MTSNSQIDSTFSPGLYAAMPSPGGCGCGEQAFTDATTFSSGEGWEYNHSANSPVMNNSGNHSNGTDTRMFAPSVPHVLPIPPDSSSQPAPMPPGEYDAVPMPMPQDLTPMDSDSLSPKDLLQFDPLSEEEALAPARPLEPASYEIPFLPPLPVPDHASSGKRVALPYTG
jgi:hypothetical protein